MGLLEVKNLNLHINDKHILQNLNIDVWEGHIHALVGINGAGKSTLAAAIMGLQGYRNVTGDIYFKDERINDLTIDQRARKGITLAWQEPARYEGISVKDFIAAGLQKNDKEKKSIIEAALKKVGMNPEEYLSRAVDETLSGGERKKIELASIIAMDPPFIMLDEPDSGIDVATLDRMAEAIQILKKRGKTVLLITHSLAVMKLADHAFLMCDGHILEKNTADKIIPYFEQNCIPCDHKNNPEENPTTEEEK